MQVLDHPLVTRVESGDPRFILHVKLQGAYTWEALRCIFAKQLIRSIRADFQSEFYQVFSLVPDALIVTGRDLEVSEQQATVATYIHGGGKTFADERDADDYTANVFHTHIALTSTVCLESGAKPSIFVHDVVELADLIGSEPTLNNRGQNDFKLSASKGVLSPVNRSIDALFTAYGNAHGPVRDSMRDAFFRVKSKMVGKISVPAVQGTFNVFGPTVIHAGGENVCGMPPGILFREEW